MIGVKVCEWQEENIKCCLHSLKDSAQEDGNVAWTKRSCLRGHLDVIFDDGELKNCGDLELASLEWFVWIIEKGGLPHVAFGRPILEVNVNLKLTWVVFGCVFADDLMVTCFSGVCLCGLMRSESVLPILSDVCAIESLILLTTREGLSCLFVG